MKALIVNPYWDTGGGGEKYTATVAQSLRRHQYRVDLAWPSEDVIKQLEKRFNLDLSGVTVNMAAYNRFRNAGNLWAKWRLERAYDLLFIVSDGSIPWGMAKRNILHFQVPFKGVNRQPWLNHWKLRSFQTIVCNSHFTQQIIDREFEIKSRVLFPPVQPVSPLPKQKLILSVGRFDNTLHQKRQDVLIEAFKGWQPHGWRLVLAGGLVAGQEKIATLKQAARGANIDIFTNPDISTLHALYGQASLYWHAAGFGQDLAEHTERAEHFGISTVEAMSAGAVPVVFAGGGQVEIVVDGHCGFFWQTPAELISKSQQLLEQETKRQQLAEAARERARQFLRRHLTGSWQTLSVSVVIPSYNGRRLLEAHLPAVILATHGAEIIVVDDASTDDTAAWLKEHYPAIRCVTLSHNSRFAAAVNAGVTAAQGEIVLLLNNDVSPEADFLAPLLEPFQDEMVFGVGCREIDQVDGQTYFQGRACGAFRRGLMVHWRCANQNAHQTLWVFGGSGAFRRSIFLSLGGMDTLFSPAYEEDHDLGYRALKRGHQLRFAPESRVHHHHESTNIQALGTRSMQVSAYKNQLLIVWKNITQPVYLLQHILWLPHHLLFTGVRSRGAFLVGFWQALCLMPQVLKKRKLETRAQKVSDTTIFKSCLI